MIEKDSTLFHDTAFDAAYHEVLTPYQLEVSASFHCPGVLAAQGDACKRGDGGISQAAALDPACAEDWFALGNMLNDVGHHEAVVACCDRAVELDPSFAAAWLIRGRAQLTLGRNQEAVGSFKHVLAVNPVFATAWLDLGNALHALGRYAEATASFDRALEYDSNLAVAWSNRGNALQELGCYRDALASCDCALGINPAFAAAWSNRGNALLMLGRSSEALSSYEQAVVLEPAFAVAWSKRGCLLRLLGHYREAIESLDHAIGIDPRCAEANANKSLVLLLLGDFAAGWLLYEWRLKNREFTSSKRSFSQPRWDGGGDIAGKTIMLHSEQGLGDTIQFCRYAELVAGLGARVLLMVPQQLAGLLSRLDGVAEVVPEGMQLPSFDLYCPLPSLPLAFGTRLDTIPSYVGGYLTADRGKVNLWMARLGEQRAPRIGLVWSDRCDQEGDRSRSIAMLKFMDALPAGFEYVSLQQCCWDGERTVLSMHPELRHFGAELTDFEETAALCSLMELVVSVDTGIAHLAGALGRPVWVLLPNSPDWRWMLGRDDSPWYPTMRLFRQADRGDWSSVLTRVREELSGWHP